MKQLKNFTPTREKTARENTPPQDTPVDTQNVEDMINQRQNRTEKELMDELMANVKKSKAEGRFSESDMLNFKNTVSPMLTSEQKKKLDEILDALR